MSEAGLFGAGLSDAVISAVTIVTECPGPKTDCHDNFGYCARKHLIRYGVSREHHGPRFALFFAVTYAPGVAVVDTNSAVKG
jgi:hypothetical protein